MTPIDEPGIRRDSPDELRAVIAEVEALLGTPLSAMLDRHRDEESEFHHPLIERLLVLRAAADTPNDFRAKTMVTTNLIWVGGVLDALRQWKGDPTWAEYQKALRDPRSCLHAVTTLTMATALKEHHPGTALLASGGPNAGPTPDLLMIVTDEHNLAVEVKTSLELCNRQEPLSESAALEFMRRKLREATDGFKAQLAQGRPGVLVVGGFDIDHSTFKALGDAAMEAMNAEPRRTQLLATVVSQVRLHIPDSKPVDWQVGFVHESRIRTNPHYRGDLRFVGRWDGEWSLERKKELG